MRQNGIWDIPDYLVKEYIQWVCDEHRCSDMELLVAFGVRDPAERGSKNCSSEELVKLDIEARFQILSIQDELDTLRWVK